MKRNAVSCRKEEDIRIVKQSKTIAVDFDGCLHSGTWPGIGKENWQAINELVRRQREGDKIILWSCREGAMLDAAVLWCMARDLKFDAINENLPENIERFGNNCRKIYADEYWDDKSVLVVADQTMVKQGPGGWIVVVNLPKKRNKFQSCIDRIRRVTCTDL